VTEWEWGRCTDPQKMLALLRGAGRASARKLRLFACACFRRLPPLLTNKTRYRRAHTYPAYVRRALKAVEVSERYTDGRADAREREAALRGIREGLGAVAWAACSAVEDPADAGEAAASSVLAATWALGEKTPAARAARRDFRGWQRATVRDLFGNPFRPVHVDPAWLAWDGGAVEKLAEAVYEERDLPSGHLDSTRLAVLADMLEEAGCTDAEVLGHLRGPGPHVRGCFAVDFLLGRA
jgi:hypothetical protein